MSFPEIKRRCVQLAHYFHIVTRKRISGTTPLFPPVRLHRVHRDNFTFMMYALERLMGETYLKCDILKNFYRVQKTIVHKVYKIPKRVLGSLGLLSDWCVTGFSRHKRYQIKRTKLYSDSKIMHNIGVQQNTWKRWWGSSFIVLCKVGFIMGQCGWKSKLSTKNPRLPLLKIQHPQELVTWCNNEITNW